MRRNEDVKQAKGLRAAVTLMLLPVGVLTYILPGMMGLQTELLFLPLFVALFAGVFCGPVPGFLVGLLIPLGAGALQQLDFIPDAAAAAASLAAAGLTSGIFYTKFKTGLGACIGGILLEVPVFALAKLVLCLMDSRSWSLGDFLDECIVSVHAGLVLPCIVIPLLILLFRKAGVMELLRGEPRE